MSGVRAAKTRTEARSRPRTDSSTPSAEELWQQALARARRDRPTEEAAAPLRPTDAQQSRNQQVLQEQGRKAVDSWGFLGDIGDWLNDYAPGGEKTQLPPQEARRVERDINRSAPRVRQETADYEADLLRDFPENSPRETDAERRETLAGLGQDRSAYDELLTDMRTGARVPESSLLAEHQMTQEEFDALTDQQRSAVTFNGLLVDAIEADRDLSRPTDGNAEYDAAMRKVFGETSDEYAPNTVALLNSLGIENSQQSLDDYLNLRAAVFDTDLGNIDNLMGLPDNIPGNALPVRQQHVSDLVQRTNDILDKFSGDLGSLVQSELSSVFQPGDPRDIVPTMSNIAQSAYNMTGMDNADDRLREYLSAASGRFGATSSTSDPVLTVEEIMGTSGPADPMMESVLYGLALRDSDPWTAEEVLEGLPTLGIDPEEFIRYLGNRLERFDRTRQVNPQARLFDDAAEQLSSDELRSIFQLRRG